MKNSYLWILGAAGVALYLINKAGASTVPAAVKALTDGTTEIFNTMGKTFETGWRYFSDGTAIDPFGNYWKSGQKIWTAPIVKRPTSGSEPIFTAPTYDI